ncbi:hypothetical protein ATANTOWER_025518 [Ataeniobius toweri]|uniref:Uncharacterized protein n=1 Tax=Ataeniobius toweri TaxID=208326 RepID=A0ABU7AB92_9TELE|nr:hypothetical protein [Ataeniobius toweri]
MSLLWFTGPLYCYLSHLAKREGLLSVEGGWTDQPQLHKTPRFTLPASPFFNQDHLSLSALIDSGCEQDLIDQHLVEQTKIETEPLSKYQPLMEKPSKESPTEPNL